jgi:hypothetical protein
MAGLLGLLPKPNKMKRRKCPFGYCVAEFDKYSEIADHVLNQRAHKEFEQYLYTRVGGFWASILAHLNETGNWPTVHEIFYADETKSISDVLPMTEEDADRTWRTNCNKHNAEDIGDYCLLPGSPLEDILQLLRRRASAPTSADTSDVERLQKHRDNSDGEVGDREETEVDSEVEEMRRQITQPVPLPPLRPRLPQRPNPLPEWGIELLNRLAGKQIQVQPRAQPRRRLQNRPRPPTSDEEEPDTEHEAREEEERHEERVFDWNQDVGPQVTRRMNQLARC